MPITKQVIKRVKQANKRSERNRHYRSDMKSMVRLMLDYVEKNEIDKAKKILPKVVKAIDTCAKKNIIQENNAAHKKSRIQKALNNLEKGGAKPAKAEKKVEKAEKVEKTEKAEKKEEAKA